MKCHLLHIIRIAAPVLFTVFLPFLFAWTPAQTEAKTAVRVKGALSMVNAVYKLGSSFEKKSPDCSVIVSGGGTDKALKGFLEKNVEIVMADRRLNKQEMNTANSLGIKPTYWVVGGDGLAVIVHPQNSVQHLTMKQLVSIFTGDYKSWKDVGGADEPITIILIPPENEAIRFFQTKYLHSRAFRFKALFRNRWGQVISKVASTTSSIALCEAYKALSAAGMVKLLALASDETSDPVLPSRYSLDTGTYPIVRPLYLITDANGNRCALQFYKYCEKHGLELH